MSHHKREARTTAFIAEQVAPAATAIALEVGERVQRDGVVERIDEKALAARAAYHHNAAILERREYGRDRVVA